MVDKPNKMTIQPMSPAQYGKERHRSAKTIIRMIEAGQLPSDIRAFRHGKYWILVRLCPTTDMD
mgnify:CR=1 FL=1